MTSLSSFPAWLLCVGLLFLSEGPQRSLSITSTALCDSGSTLAPFSYEVATDYAGECDTSSQLVSTPCHFEGNGVQQIRVWDATDGSDTFFAAISLSTFDGQACTLGDIPSNQDPLASFEFSSGERLLGNISVVRTAFPFGTRITKLSFSTSDGNSFLAEGVTTSTATSILDEIDSSNAYLMGFFGFEASSSGSWIQQSIDGIGFFFLKEIENQYLTNVVYTDLTDTSVLLETGPVVKLFYSFDFTNPKQFEAPYQMILSGIEASETREWSIDHSFSWGYGESVAADIPYLDALAEPVGDALWQMGLQSQALYTHSRFVSNPNEVALDLSVPACSYGSVVVTFLVPTPHTFQFEGSLMYEFTDGSDYELLVSGSYQGVVAAELITDQAGILQYQSGEADCADLAPATAPSTTVTVTVPTTLVTASPVIITTASPTIFGVDSTKAPTMSPAFVDGFTGPPTTPPVVIAETPALPTVKFPTATPSFSPTKSLQMELFQNVSMFLTPWNTDVEMTGRNIISFEKLTATHIERHIGKSNEGGADELFDIKAFTNIVYQKVNIPSSTTNTRDSGASYTPSTLRISFDTVLYFRATRDSNEYDISKIIFDAWDTTEDRDEYIQVLLAETNGLGDVLQVVVEVDGVSTEADGFTGGDKGPVKTEKKGGKAGPVVGAVVGGLFFVMIVIALYLPRIRPLMGKKPADGLSESTGKEADSDPEMSRGVQHTTTEIQAEQQDAISCLEDPVVENNSYGRILDDQTASVDDDFEYYKLWQAVGMTPSVADATMDDTATRDSSVLSGVSKWGQNQGMQADYFFADDASFERQFDDLEDRFEVIAPEGKLGFIVGTPQGGGIPVVHAIKDTSVLADRVMMGDRLVSVDGMDCTAMTGAEVSEYISLRSSNHQRILEFVRVRANNAPGFG